MNLTETIVIIASHSGGTFASLAVSNLLQAFTKKIFVITSEFDTQVSAA
jgi:fructoselysine-6-P-deglycase FrlB-like protein